MGNSCSIVSMTGRPTFSVFTALLHFGFLARFPRLLLILFFATDFGIVVECLWVILPTGIGTRRINTRFASICRKDLNRDFFGFFGGLHRGEISFFFVLFLEMPIYAVCNLFCSSSLILEVLRG